MNRVSMIVSCMALWLVSGAATGNLVLNGDFETGDFMSWTPSGNEDLTFVDLTPHSGTYAAWLGPTDTPGFLSQQLATVPGTRYDLHFWLRHEPFGAGTPSQFEVWWNGGLVNQRSDLDTFPYAELAYPGLVASAASTELKFGFQEDTDYFQLDDVSVSIHQVPEPGTLILLGSGLAILLRSSKRSDTSVLGNERRVRIEAPSSTGGPDEALRT